MTPKFPDAGSDTRPTLLIALGGNALIRKGQTGTIDEQFTNLRLPLAQAARLSRDWRLIITHGNGPQVGDLLQRQEQAAPADRLPLEILVAQTQGWLGYMIESTLDTALMDLGPAWHMPLVSLISYVVVNRHDPAFKKPTKPVGPVLDAGSAADAPFATVQTAKGLRRVVASPEPVTIVEKQEIRKLIGMGFIVICCGGGGIPVVREGRTFCGVDAVIDKDLASSRLAAEVGVDRFIIATDVAGAYTDYGGPDQKLIERLSPVQARALLAKGELPAGSMGPKVEAAARFAESGEGRQAVICHIEAIDKAVAGQAGTVIEG